ncbi:Shedu anti-phage system protein SduA domain-containing protein [Azospirillum lipoferum]|uniref:Shedu anti-phage system protein SduA domain-containing protein n=1 Tax=Azospirillum lipoferum TaxID=193 RepID=UPI001395D4E3|nr:Shedu anti-phage system protein SduA domain-containing protein [Azospirillum lipoferum]
MESSLDRDGMIYAATNDLIARLTRHYYQPLYNFLSHNPHLISKFTGFLLNPEYISVYWGKTHVAVEYSGSEVIDRLPEEGVGDIKISILFNTDNILEDIIGFKSDSNSNFEIPLAEMNEDMIFPTNRGWEKMHNLGWNVEAQNNYTFFNMRYPKPQIGKFCRIVNSRFFDADETGLIVRHIKWMDFFPIFTERRDGALLFGFNISNVRRLVENDAKYIYPMPDDFKYVQLPKINRFIEIWGNRRNRETDITSFLSKPENEFILTMKFGATRIASELICEWQSERRESIKPDFFVIHPDGYADIVEFKLPDIAGDVIVGRKNRESFSAWLNSYISQTRNYAEYFDDPNNRKWFFDKYGFNVIKPRRWVVVGRRGDFEGDIWRKIVSDYRDISIMNFDDLVDGVSAQFYK